MIQVTKPLRMAAALAFVSLAGTSTLADNQTPAGEAADAAEQVADAAEQAAIQSIDPRTGGPSLVVDPSLPTPYNTDVAETVAGLPPIGEDTPEIAAGREPGVTAARMISREVVQDVPPTPPASANNTRRTASKDPFTVKSILPIEGTIRYGEWFWDESRAPTKGKLVITVDLDARVISAFRDGHEIGTAVALLGTKSHPTPLGTFPILTKEKDNVSEKYNNAPMPYTLRMTWDGIAIHGSPVANGYASHGCVGVPEEFAAKLFAIAKRGDKVIVTRGKMIGVGDAII